MKKIMIIAGLLSLALLASCTKKQEQEIVEVVTSDPQVAVEQEAPVEAPALTAYSDDMLGQAESTVLFFHSASCGSCRATEKSLLESGTPDHLKVLKVNFDEDSELRKKYEIPKYHHFVQVDANGEMIKKWSGSFTLEDIQKQLEVTDSDEETSDETVQDDVSDTQVVVEETEVETPTVLAGGTYANYDSSLVGTTDNTVLFFHAAWCGKCNAADAEISGNNIPDDLSVLKVDYDTAGELRKKFGVTTQHTFVQIDADGNEVAKWQGSKNIAELTAKLQ